MQFFPSVHKIEFQSTKNRYVVLICIVLDCVCSVYCGVLLICGTGYLLPCRVTIVLIVADLMGG